MRNKRNGIQRRMLVNTLYILEYAKGTSQAKAMSKIKPIALAVMELCKCKDIS